MEFEDLLTLVDRRYEYLVRLARSPAYKRDLVEELDDSRSTVDRAMKELTAAGLLERGSDGQYGTSHAGDVLRRTVDETRETVATIDEVNSVLSHLPTDAALPPALFRGAAVHSATGPAPMEAIQHATSVLVDADTIRGLSVADHESKAIRDLHERSVVAGELDAEVVFTRPMTDRLFSAYPDLTAQAEESDSVRLYTIDELPFGLFIAERNGTERVLFGIYDENQLVQAIVENDSPDAVAWANQVFEQYRDAADDLFSAQ
ncbi:helix-turn-helix transcriptional regulator [Haloarchaeobius sp. DFWS5]|uniref:helix-turn-helix transcriptional regulator n=1 Tax=Haloarchaeobius sp. DFWS5 TaxID=3446114 RepID=UPI003EBD9946